MAGQAAAGGCACICVTIVIFIWMGISSISPTQVALKYNWAFKTIDPQALNVAGMGFYGPTVSLLKYDKTIQTLYYNGADLLDARTADGLPLVLGVTFQFRLLPEKLFQLYHQYEQKAGDYKNFFRLIGIHIITEQATKFTAYQFFNEKQKIAEAMKNVMDDYFTTNLFATVESLQINQDDLPELFKDKILEAATMKQNITRMVQLKLAKEVEFQTAIKVATAQANATINRAVGDSNQILQNGRAVAQVIEAYVEGETESYKMVKDELGLEGDNLINYIWYDQLAGGGVAGTQQADKDMSVFVGVSPQAYISGGLSQGR